MATRIQIRRDSSINWEANNPVLALGEPGLETDTFIVKYGDGSTAWNSLPYANLDSLADFTTSNLAEGSRLYFSNARVYANLVSAGFSTYATNGQLSLYATNNQLGLYATNADLQTSYLTTEYVDIRLQNYARTTSLTTSNVTEVTNLYFTNTRAVGAFTAGSGISKADNGLLVAAVTTAIVPEVTNLYYSNARVSANVSTLGYAPNTFVVNQISKIQYPSLARLSVTNSGSSYYSFSSHYSSNNPNIYAISGTTISFDLDVAGHPFLLQENSGNGFFNITSSTQISHQTLAGSFNPGSFAQGQVAGTLYWNVPFGTTNTYQYRCSIHSNMVGNVIVKDISVI
jgi:plastocyanin